LCSDVINLDSLILTAMKIRKFTRNRWSEWTCGWHHIQFLIKLFNAAPIVITTQPIVAPTCELQNATITLIDNGVTLINGNYLPMVQLGVY
jgi:hypothetical protein